MSSPTTRGYEDAFKVFGDEGLVRPPVPERFQKRLRVIQDWCFATRKIDPMAMYMFEMDINKMLTKGRRDYVAFCHSGHGANSYALTYHLVDGPLAIFAQVGWGGVYSDGVSATRAANALFGRCQDLISASPRAQARGVTRTPGRLVVIESEMRGALAWGWLEGPPDSGAFAEWLQRHSVLPEADSRRVDARELPTVAALEWLNAASREGSQ